jgi:hypothetical protein
MIGQPVINVAKIAPIVEMFNPNGIGLVVQQGPKPVGIKGNGADRADRYQAIDTVAEG